MERKEAGQGLVEYAQILQLVTIAVLAVIYLIGEPLRSLLCEVYAAFSFFPSACAGITF
jgi:Flp pilus assembly pilin Flp